MQVLESMKALDFDTRTLITKYHVLFSVCILWCHEHAGLQSYNKYLSYGRDHVKTSSGKSCSITIPPCDFKGVGHFQAKF